RSSYVPLRALAFSLHDALPISVAALLVALAGVASISFSDRHAWLQSIAPDESTMPENASQSPAPTLAPGIQTITVVVERNQTLEDRKSTRLNSSHVAISYAVFW